MTALTEVKRLIDTANISQLSRDSDVSRSQLNRIADGRTLDPGIETVEQVLNALGYDLKVVRRQVCPPDNEKLPKKEMED